MTPEERKERNSLREWCEKARTSWVTIRKSDVIELLDALDVAEREQSKAAPSPTREKELDGTPYEGYQVPDGWKEKLSAPIPCTQNVCDCTQNESTVGGHISTGFRVEIKMHTKDAEKAITSPEALRFLIGHMLDSWGIQEEIDYTLEVTRTYGH